MQTFHFKIEKIDNLYNKYNIQTFYFNKLITFDNLGDTDNKDISFQN